ncbi:Cytochrome P450 2B19 [Toxocara canis]|uniref:Cytochrome P450 2B19 n=2 Tax=Toxocara canis TaxID=6265 RepID=A0A0B2UJI2_TOXCA|nr:Cytochrome P450 2B19 [Toxocara canis]VDM37379.1 unnamed protein product [Toxocara canis]
MQGTESKSVTPLRNLITSMAIVIASIASLRALRYIAHSLNLAYVGLSILTMCYLFYELYWKRRWLPPGPTPWLLAGNMLNFLCYESVDDMFLSWKQKYGAVMTFWVGPIPLVMVNEVEAMKKYFVRNADTFSNRWRNHVTDTFMGGVNGVVQIDGDKWREQRRFSLHVLRDFGVGRALMEDKIHFEVAHFIEYLDQNRGQELNLCQATAVCVGNIINNILFGHRFPQGSIEFHKLHSLLDEQSQLVISPVMGAYIAAPWLTEIPLVNAKWKQLLTIRDQLWGYLDVHIKQHKKNFNPEADPTDFIYSYMKEMHRREANDIHPGFFGECQMKMLLLDLFFAGMETTVTTMKWGFLMVVIHPHTQNRIQKELDQCGATIQLSDRNKCPYTMATLNEIQRIANILPINLLRTVAEDVYMDGYFYPAGTLCIPQISTVMGDHENFDDPKAFRPERFLESDGKTIKRYDAFMPFSIGKRQCLGESLARAELFLIFANALRNFRLRAAPSCPNPSTKRLLGLTVSPPHYKCLVERRSHVS